MTQVTTAQGDMARTLEAPANQLRVLRAEITQVARAIGNLFIPILTKALPYVIAFLQIVRELANALAKLFGFELTDVDWDGVNRGAVAAGSFRTTWTPPQMLPRSSSATPWALTN